jgi:hypothetical protein
MMLFQLLCAPVAQMDRASASEAEGREFDPHRARHSKQLSMRVYLFVLVVNRPYYIQARQRDAIL